MSTVGNIDAILIGAFAAAGLAGAVKGVRRARRRLVRAALLVVGGGYGAGVGTVCAQIMHAGMIMTHSL